MDEPWGEFGEEEQVEEEPNSPPWEVEFDEEPMMSRQEEYENEQESSDEWLEIVETEEGLDTEPREAPLPYDDLEEPSWEHEEDQKRVDDAKKIVDEHLNSSEQNEGQWSPPDLQAAKKKKKKEDDENDKKINAKSDPSAINVPPAPAPSAPPPPGTQSQQKLPDEQKKPPPPPAKPPQQQPAPVQTTLSTATGSTSMPTVGVARQPHADQPGAPIALPIASPVPALDMSSNNPASGYSQDLGGLGQIGVFSSDGGLSHLNHRMDSFAVLLTFIFVVLYTRTS